MSEALLRLSASHPNGGRVPSLVPQKARMHADGFLREASTSRQDIRVPSWHLDQAIRARPAGRAKIDLDDYLQLALPDTRRAQFFGIDMSTVKLP